MARIALRPACGARAASQSRGRATGWGSSAQRGRVELFAGFGEVGVVQSALKGAGEKGWVEPQAGFGEAGGGEGEGKRATLPVERRGMHPSKHGATQLSLSTTGAQDAEGAAFSTPTSTPSRPPIPFVPMPPPTSAARTGFLRGRRSCRLQNHLFFLFLA